MDFDTNPAATTAMTTGNTNTNSTMNTNSNNNNNNNNDIGNNNSNNNNNNNNNINNMSASETTNPTNMLAAFMAGSPILKTEYDIDVIRLIGQHLSSLGLKQTVSLLLQESGLQKLDHPLPERFKDHIMSGEWAEATALVDELAQLITSAPLSNNNRLANAIPTDSQTLVTAPTSNNQSPTLGCGGSFEINATPMMVSSTPPPAPPPPPPQAAAWDPMSECEHLDLTDKRKIANAIRLAVAEQKFLEYLEDGHHLKACRCLRLEISPFRDVEYVQHLTTLLMCKSPEVFRSKANWPGKGLKSRQLVVERIQRYIPPLISLPPRRLDTLLQQALQLQRDRCILHIPRVDDNQQLVELHNNNNNNSSMAARGSIESTTSSTGSHNMILNGSDDFTANNSNCNNNNNNNTGNAAAQHTNGHTAAAAATTTTTSSSSATTTTPSSSPSSMSLFTAAGGVASASQYNNNKQFADLKQDHTCAVDKFPLQARQQIDTHKSEVWFCAFSNDGTRLATGGLGGKVKIWHLDPVERQLVEKCTLDCNSYSVTCLSWSPNGTYLLVCGPEDRPDLWIWNVNKEEVHNMISLSENESATTCSWHMSGEKFAAASIKGNFHTYDLDGNRLGTREGVRVQYLSFLHRDPNFILAADTLRRIKAYSVKDMSLETYEEDILEERHPIMSFVIDKQDRFIAVNLEKQGVHLWDYKLKTLVRMFPGVMQRNMTIFSSFSGLDSRFLASGSEDGKVYIYNVNKDQPVVVLYGHSRCVNCVAWNPRYPEMLVSVSDDRTVRLWAPMESSPPSSSSLSGAPHPQLRSHPPTYALSSNSNNNSGHLC